MIFYNGWEPVIIKRISIGIEAILEKLIHFVEKNCADTLEDAVTPSSKTHYRNDGNLKTMPNIKLTKMLFYTLK